jgi:hypothetical protein
MVLDRLALDTFLMRRLSKDASTLWREAQEFITRDGIALDSADPLEVLENAMRYFYAVAIHGARHKAPVDEVAKMFGKAAQLAAWAALYRHPRLTAVANVTEHSTMDGIRSDATVEELCAALAVRIAYLRDQGAVDLDALPAPSTSSGGLDRKPPEEAAVDPLLSDDEVSPREQEGS